MKEYTGTRVVAMRCSSDICVVPSGSISIIGPWS